MVIRVFMWGRPCVIPESKSGRASNVSILNIVCLISGVAFAHLGHHQSERRPALEWAGGILIIAGLVMAAFGQRRQQLSRPRWVGCGTSALRRAADFRSPPSADLHGDGTVAGLPAIVGFGVMKLTAIALIALAEIGSGQATGERVSVPQLMRSPKGYIGKNIVVSNIPCVDNPKGGFLCIVVSDGQALRIEVVVLGAKTNIDIAERLTQGCRGSANLSRPACRVDAEIEPRNEYRDVMVTSDGSMPIAVIYSGSIEMYAPKRMPKR